MIWIGLDFGTKRIGAAVSDGPAWAARGVATIQRQGGRHDLHAVLDLVAEHEIEGIVVGLPLNMDGSEGRMARLARKFVEDLSTLVSLPIHMWDERLSSFEAESELSKAGKNSREQKGLVDQVAATVILKGFLESRQLARNGEANHE